MSVYCFSRPFSLFYLLFLFVLPSPPPFSLCPPSFPPLPSYRKGSLSMQGEGGREEFTVTGHTPSWWPSWVRVAMSCDQCAILYQPFRNGGENHTGYNYIEHMHFPTFHGMAVTCETLYRIAEFPVSTF